MGNFMPLPLPSLDDRAWKDLTDQGTALIPRYSPDVTVRLASDPGITLLEMLAWLTEMTIYRLNRVPDRHREKFLHLLGFTREAPQPAHAFLSFALDSSAAPFELPAGVQFQATTPEGLTVPFESVRDLEVSPATLNAIQWDSGNGNLQNLTSQWLQGTPLSVFGNDPQPGAALYLGFSSLLSQTPLALGFRMLGPGNDVGERRRIIEEWQDQQSFCAPVTTRISCPDGVGSVAGQGDSDDLPPYHSAQLVWEVFTMASSGWWKLHPTVGFTRPYPGEVRDDTRSLTLDGIVEVNLPPAITPIALGQVPTPLYYLRCRLDTGSFDAPPVVLSVFPNSVFARQTLPAWTSFSISAGVVPQGPTPIPGQLTGFSLQLDDQENISAITFSSGAASSAPEAMVLDYQSPTGTRNGHISLGIAFVGFGSGLPDQTVSLPTASIEIKSFHVYTFANGNWQEWTLRKDFDASGRADLHAVLDPSSGILTFGNGERGCVVLPGSLIFCIVKSTLADLGNVGPGTIAGLLDTPWNTVLLGGLPSSLRTQLGQIVTNHTPAAGGASRETLDHAIGRAVEVVHAHERLLDLCSQKKTTTLDRIAHTAVRALVAPHRGVNLVDLERLALDVPGTRVARARAWAEAHPDYPCLQAPGVVTITVLPDAPVAKPQPSVGLLAAIKRFLDRRRIVCTRLEVVGPQFVQVTVTASVQTQVGASLERVRQSIVRALNDFLDPRQGGPDGLGWPFGREVSRSEILGVIRDVPGVDYVSSLALVADSGASQCGNLTLCRTALATPGNHQITVG
jgi:hypothetical protein